MPDPTTSGNTQLSALHLVSDHTEPILEYVAQFALRFGTIAINRLLIAICGIRQI
jgi:hypothetical protein